MLYQKSLSFSVLIVTCLFTAPASARPQASTTFGNIASSTKAANWATAEPTCWNPQPRENFHCYAAVGQFMAELKPNRFYAFSRTNYPPINRIKVPKLVSVGTCEFKVDLARSLPILYISEKQIRRITTNLLKTCVADEGNSSGGILWEEFPRPVFPENDLFFELRPVTENGLASNQGDNFSSLRAQNSTTVNYLQPSF